MRCDFCAGVQITTEKDNLGQQYISPEDAILKRRTDIIIVGRGIYRVSHSHNSEMHQLLKLEIRGFPRLSN